MSGTHIARSGLSRSSRIQPGSAYATHRTRAEDRLPDRWREFLPEPASFYRSRIEKVGTPNAKGWAACCCPLHEDRRASASVNLITGGFRCHGCGARGDLVSFHMRWAGLDFMAAVRDLMEGWS